MNLSELQNIHFGALELLAKQAVEGFITGLHRSPLHGFSVEFAEHRLYNQGESTRHIDWKLFGRTDKLFIKKYEEETNVRVHFLLDLSGSMRYPAKGMSKLQFSIFSILGLIQLVKRQRDAFALTAYSENIIFQSEAKSSLAHQRFMVSQLERFYQESFSETKTSTANVLHEIAEKIPRRSMVVLFSDMLSNDLNNKEDLFNAIQHVRFKKHELVLFHVVDKKTELLLDFDSRPYEFIDAESGEKLKLSPLHVREQYQQAAGEYYREIKNRCIQYGVDFVKVDIAQDYTEVLRSFLLKRERLF